MSFSNTLVRSFTYNTFSTHTYKLVTTIGQYATNIILEIKRNIFYINIQLWSQKIFSQGVWTLHHDSAPLYSRIYEYKCCTCLNNCFDDARAYVYPTPTAYCTLCSIHTVYLDNWTVCTLCVSRRTVHYLLLFLWIPKIYHNAQDYIPYKNRHV